MGTRGLFGVRINNVDKITYNHFDSYPSMLGQNIVDYLKTSDVETMRGQADNIMLVDEDGCPTAAQIEQYKNFMNLEVGDRNIHSWYSLLRNLQGELGKVLEAGVMIDNKDFIQDSLFCEWAYIVNLDSNKFEVYKGFQKKPHGNGRYASVVDIHGYYPCALVGEWDLDKIPDDWQIQVKKS